MWYHYSVTSTTKLVREIKKPPPSLAVEPVSPEAIISSGWAGESRVPDRWYLALDLIIQGQSITAAAQAAQMSRRELLAILDSGQVDMHRLVQHRTDGVRRRVYLMTLLELLRRVEDPERAKGVETRNLIDLTRATRELQAESTPVQRRVDIDKVWKD
jgi:hypothetical protein